MLKIIIFVANRNYIIYTSHEISVKLNLTTKITTTIVRSFYSLCTEICFFFVFRQEWKQKCEYNTKNYTWRKSIFFKYSPEGWNIINFYSYNIVIIPTSESNYERLPKIVPAIQYLILFFSSFAPKFNEIHHSVSVNTKFTPRSNFKIDWKTIYYFTYNYKVLDGGLNDCLKTIFRHNMVWWK